MDRTGNARGVAAAGGIAHRVHAIRIFAQQRLHLAALLILFAAIPLRAADDIDFNATITQQEFRTFSRIVGQGIFATPVQPARSSGVLSFDVGVAATLVRVDTKAAYWTKAVGNDFSTNGYIAVPRLVVSKGFGSGTLSGTYAKVKDSTIKIYGGAFDLPIIRGSIATPELALRASYSTLSGVSQFKEKVYGLEAFLSKGVGPFTPYVAVGRMRTNATGTVTISGGVGPTQTFKDTSNLIRYTAGVRLSLFVPKIVIEATQAEVRSYAAKISFGF